MTRRALRPALVLALAALPAGLVAQAAQNATLRRALQAYDQLDLRQAQALAQQALGQRLSPADQERAYELLGFAYGQSLADFNRAVDAFEKVLLLNSEHEPDPNRMTTMVRVAWETALRSGLYVRHLAVDSARFVVGKGDVPIRFSVTARAVVKTHVVGPKTSVLVDSAIGEGDMTVRWSGATASGDPIAPGDYTIVVDAASGQNSYSMSRRIRVSAGAVDTLPHLTTLPGFTALPETAVPPRSWRPMGLAFLYTGIAAAGSLALENGALGTGPRRELGVVGAAALVTGLVMTLKKPAAEPVPANIRYNQLLAQQLERRNADIAQQNVQLRRQVGLTVVPIADGAR